MNKLDLSVVLTTHLRPKLLIRALESLLNQTNTNFQIILCSDEGSQDTKDVARNHLRDGDSLLILPHLKGPSQTRNEGVRNVKYKNLIFLDDDDTFDANYLEDIINKIRSSPNALYYSNFTRVEEERGTENIVIQTTSKIHQANNLTNILVGNYIPNNSFVVDSSIAKSILFDSSLGSHEDWDYLIQLSKALDFVHVDVYGPRVHIVKSESRNNSSYQNGSVGLDYLAIYRKHRVATPDVRVARQSQLQAFGISVPVDLL